MRRIKYVDKEKTRTIWEEICSMENLRKAHQNARRNKSWYKEVKDVDNDQEYYLTALQSMLVNKTYKTSKYVSFIKTDGLKEREIFKLPYFPDRICQWAIIQVIEPFLIKQLIKTTYSAIPGRGTHKCLNQVRNDMWKDKEGCKYCLKLDIKKYYPSIDHELLKRTYRRIFKDNNLLWLLDEIIDSTEGKVGIPIGNYLSQYSGNIFLSSFDHWIKEVKGIKYYYRYMDDCVILHNSKDFLHQLQKEIDQYLTEELKLKLKENWQIFPTFQRGLDFVGYRIFNDYTLLRKTTCKKFKVKFKQLQKKSNLAEKDLSSINSYKGWLQHCNSYRLWEKYSNPILIEKGVEK